MPTDLLLETSEPAARPRTSRALTHLDISGMTCGNCARHVTEAIQSVAGVDNAQVSLDSHQATVFWKPHRTPDTHAVIKAVEAEGFGARILDTVEPDSGEKKVSGWRLNLALGLPVTGLLMLGEWAFHLRTALWFNWFAFLSSGIV